MVKVTTANIFYQQGLKFSELETEDKQTVSSFWEYPEKKIFVNAI